MEIFDFNVSPGSKVQEIHYEGSYLYYVSGAAGGADPSIVVRHDASGNAALLLPGQGFRLPAGEKGRRWLIANFAGQAAIAGRVLVLDGEFIDNRITGSVEVIDGGKERTKAGMAFGVTCNMPPVAAKYNSFYLYNTTADKSAVVNGIIVSSAIAQNIYITTGAGAPTTPPVGAGSAGVSKDAGGAASSVLAYQVTEITQPVASIMAAVGVQAGPVVTVELSEPIIVRPGNWMAITAAGVNAQMSAFVQFWEEPV